MGKEGEKTFKQKVCDNWNGFRHFMWDPKEKTVMGRGGKSWAKISLFYAIYYACLAGFWAGLLAIFLQTISYDRPKYTALVSTPALTSIPVTNEGLRINWQPDNPDSYSRIVEMMQETYDELQQLGASGDLDCSQLEAGTIDEPQRRCKFDVDTLGPNCQPPNFGWDSLKPCIYFKLNRVFGYIPENYASQEDVPDNAKAIYKDDNVAITCFERNVNDDKKTVNATMPFPTNGIPFGFFPYVGTGIDVDARKMLVEPVVAVQVSLFEVNQVASILCQTFTGNISPNGGLFDTDDESTLRIYLNPRRVDTN